MSTRIPFEFKKEYIYKMPLQFIFAVGVYFLYAIPGKIAGLVMIPLGIATGWKTKLTWPWDSADTPTTGTYYDDWYPNLDAPQHSSISKFFYNLGPFWREYYWRVRNSFSNAMRYSFINPNPRGVHLVGVEEYWGNGWYYRFHTKKWWYAQFRYSLRTDGDQGWTTYVGWKLDRWTGFGLTVRIPKKNFIPYDQDYKL
jgi:hypothetical protein